MTKDELRNLQHKIDEINRRYLTDYTLEQCIRITHKLRTKNLVEVPPTYTCVSQELDYIEDTLKEQSQEMEF